MAIVFISYLHIMPICDQNSMIACSVVFEILVFPFPSDATKLSEKAQAINCFVYELFISEKLRDHYLSSKHSPAKSIPLSTE